MSTNKKAKARQKRNKRKKEDSPQASGNESKEETSEMDEAKKWLAGLQVNDVLNADIFKESSAAAFKQKFNAGAPFKHYFLENFMDNEFCKRLKDELTSIEYFNKSNDLYEFVQSDDLKKCESPLISKFRDVLYSPEFRNVLRNITGIELSGLGDSVDMSAAVYQNTHRLLCHDDKLVGRRIAYIVYLVPEDWNAATDGGSLELYTTDKDGQAASVTTTITPKWNSFAFFEVSPVSFHRVGEVLVDKNRLSISGWFHGQPIASPPDIVEPLPEFGKVSKGAATLDDWISRDYRRPATIKQICKQFGEDSSIQLENFLRKDKYELLVPKLAELSWRLVGPANKRQYMKADAVELKEDSLVAQFQLFLRSQEFSAFVQKLTGLETISVTSEVRQFAPGHYTLAHDQDPENKQSGLDVVLCCLPAPAQATAPKGLGRGKAAKKDRWNPSMGGSTHYIAEGEDKELLSIDPGSNTISIVYRRGGGVLRFVKYVTHKASSPRYDFSAVFRVKEEDAEEEEEEGDEGEDGGEGQGDAVEAED